MAKFGNDVYEFYNLGIGDPVPVSAASRLALASFDRGSQIISVRTNYDDSEDDRPRNRHRGKTERRKIPLLSISFSVKTV